MEFTTLALPLVSVIIPVYNMRDYLSETLDFILASDYPNIEIIVMDDGSMDQSLEIAQLYAKKTPQIKYFTQVNSGVSVARNHAIRLAQGEYILPVNADDLISSNYIREAVNVLNQNPQVKVVACEVEMFGEKNGKVHYPAFSYRLLARKNLIANSALFRKSDWEKAGGYCEEEVFQEDWDFWLSMFQTGGAFVRLPFVGLRCRVQKTPRQLNVSNRKKKIVDMVNHRHKYFLNQQLGGKLHYNRTWSQLLNFFIRIVHSERIVVSPDHLDLAEFTAHTPFAFDQAGTPLKIGRNKVKVLDANGQHVVVKSFRKPAFLNRFAYGFFRKSKARQSYEYAQRLCSEGIGTPAPIAYFETRHWGFLTKSYYLCLLSACKFTFNDLIENKNFPERNAILSDIGWFTALMHQKGIYPLDYSAGNILFSRQNDETLIEIVDLNRMSFGKIGLRKGCRNFQRLNIGDFGLRLMAKSYAQARNMNEAICVKNLLKMRQHIHL
ncbi:hypothetical protein FACS1894162_4290 [Bacteroidia bacterium]|nr:hypothetical protein FACS1894162_4290 [Bacteroidia bacterium]